jgi:hypothetical protein
VAPLTGEKPRSCQKKSDEVQWTPETGVGTIPSPSLQYLALIPNDDLPHL